MRPEGIARDRRYLPELESLRGIAIALVFVYHADVALLAPSPHHRAGASPNPALAYVWAGHTGVTLFFVLSAFLLALPFLEQAYGGRRVSPARFWARRALRILPLYAAAVVAGTVLTATTAADLWRGVPYLVFLESIPGLLAPLSPWSEVWWSLATEVQFYAVLPLLALGFGRARRVTLALLVAWGLAYLALARDWLVQLEPFLRAQSFPGRSPVFLCGIAAAWLWLRHGDALRRRFRATRWLAAGGGDAVLLAVLLALGVLLRWATYEGFLPLEASKRFVWHVPEGVLWTAVVLAVLLLPLRARALLSNPMLARLGVLSYSIYLLHFPIFHYTLAVRHRVFPGAGGGWTGLGAGWFVLSAAICLLAAAVTYRAIERPFLARKARLGHPAAGASRSPQAG